MKTRTTIEVPSSDIKISHQDQIFTIGSCFADRVGSKLRAFKFNGCFNPFGIFYNPVSILNALKSAVSGDIPDTEHFCDLDEVQVHYDYHSVISAQNQEDYLSILTEKQKECSEGLKESHTIIITLGSAYVYRYISTGKIIANCHKQEAQKFNRQLLSYEECRDSLHELIKLLRGINPDIHIILTVSPVRHTRDTLIGNSRSKSTLLNAIHHVVDTNKACTYYPAYEIMVDDLRDYRYYKDDMIHPTHKAFEYIWGLFSEGFIKPESQNLNNKIENINRAVRHRPFRMDSPSHQAFIENTLTKIQKLQEEYPNLDWEYERGELLKFKQS